MSSIRVRLDLAYDGTDFSGWAKQPGLRTVQGSLEEGLERILREPVQLTVAGRTDAGVHARGQVAHVDIPGGVYDRLPGHSDREPAQALADRLGGVLPNDVVVYRATEAPTGFDARFSATERMYRYRVADSRQNWDPLTARWTLWRKHELDLDLLNEASATLLGLRDFAAFCRPREGATTIRDLAEFAWVRDEAGRAVATVRADAFCHSMVRSLVGAVLAVGERRKDEPWLGEVAQSSVRSQAIAVAPAHGLTLESVSYPADEDLAARAQQTRAKRSEGGSSALVQ